MDNVIKWRIYLTPYADTRRDSNNASVIANGSRLRLGNNLYRVVYPSGWNLNLSRLAQKQDAWWTTEVLHEVKVAAIIIWAQYVELDL